jgi:hypothetical protein
MRPVFACASALAALALMAMPQGARADAVDECVAAAASGQKLERAGQLRAAREAYLACDKAACPDQVRGVCDHLLNSVEASLPTVIFGARDAQGNDLLAITVRVDGTLVSSSLDGKATPIDPGPHTIVFERPNAPAVEQKAVIRESEKNRAILVTFPALVAATATKDEAVAHRPIPPLVYVFSGIGVASLAVFVGLDADGQSRYSACNSGAGCSPSTVSSLSAERDAALTLGGIGIAALGVATALYLTRPTDKLPATAVTFDVRGVAGGAMLGARGQF